LQASNVQYTITYKKGHVGGNIGMDTISITETPIVLTNQTIGLTDEATLDFRNASCDGIFVSGYDPPTPRSTGSTALSSRAQQDRLWTPELIVLLKTATSLTCDHPQDLSSWVVIDAAQLLSYWLHLALDEPQDYDF
jgi:hypothetical protein